MRTELYFLSSQKNRPSLFGMPLIVPCTVHTTKKDLYDAVWIQVSRLASPLPPQEASNHAQDWYAVFTQFGSALLFGCKSQLPELFVVSLANYSTSLSHFSFEPAVMTVWVTSTPSRYELSVKTATCVPGVRGTGKTHPGVPQRHVEMVLDTSQEMRNEQFSLIQLHKQTACVFPGSAEAA